MKSAVLSFIAVVGLTNAARYDYNGESWKKEFDIVDYAQMDIPGVFYDWATYFDISFNSEGEEYKSFIQFTTNLQKIAQHNSDHAHSYKLRPNQFTHMTADEFKLAIHGEEGSCLRGANKDRFPLLNKLERKLDIGDLNVPSSVDWTTQGVVTPVKNQGQCGSCWAFSTTGSLECDYAIKTGTLNSLSEQQLVDCSTRNAGCNGGEMDLAFKYVEENGGLCSESSYPYKGRDGTCQSSSCGTKYNANNGYHDVTARDESALLSAAAEGCVSVAIEADQFAFQSYSSGVLTGSCGTSLDHGVLVVGYGSESGTDYWKVKNSWGADWGENGYVLICRDCGKNGSQGECGINDDPSYPTFA